MRRRRHISEHGADIALLVLLILACVGIFTLARWCVAFWISLLSLVMIA